MGCDEELPTEQHGNTGEIATIAVHFYDNTECFTEGYSYTVLFEGMVA